MSMGPAVPMGNRGALSQSPLRPYGRYYIPAAGSSGRCRITGHEECHAALLFVAIGYGQTGWLPDLPCLRFLAVDRLELQRVPLPRPGPPSWS